MHLLSTYYCVRSYTTEVKGYRDQPVQDSLETGVTRLRLGCSSGPSPFPEPEAPATPTPTLKGSSCPMFRTSWEPFF